MGKILINLLSLFRNCSWKTNMFWIEFVTRNILFQSWKKISKQFFFFKILVSKIFFKNLPARDFKKTFCDHIYIFLWNMSYQNGSSMFQVYTVYLQIKNVPYLIFENNNNTNLVFTWNEYSKYKSWGLAKITYNSIW